MQLRISKKRVYKDMFSDILNKYNENTEENNNDNNEEYNMLSSLIDMVGERIFLRAVQYTPVDTGNLRNSIYRKNVGDGIIIGYSADYATYVHEISFYNHKYPTRCKFLEDAAFEVMKELDIMDICRIGISYDPLEIYINTPGGIDIAKHKEFIDKLSSSKNIKKYVRQLYKKISFERGEYSDSFEQYIEYWSNRRHKTFNEIYSDWVKRLNTYENMER